MSLIADIQLQILQSLRESPSHGYELHKEVGAATSTVYSHLDELAEAGMIEQNTIDEDSRGKIEYRITGDGEKLLELLA